MGKTLRGPILRSMRPRPAALASPPLTLPLRSYPPEDYEDMRRVLAGFFDVPGTSCYEMPGLSFPSPPTILDVGANVGASTLWFSRRFPGCVVHAYEPHPGHVAAFAENMRDMAVNATLHPVAVVGPRWPEGRLMLFDGVHGPRECSLFQLGSQRQSGVAVETMRARELPAADILKIDTEGCEVEIVDEYAHLDSLKAVLLECHRPGDFPRLVDRLRQAGLAVSRDDSRRGAIIGEVIFIRA